MPEACRGRRDPRHQGDAFDRLLRRKSEDPESAPPKATADTGPDAALLVLAGGPSGAPPIPQAPWSGAAVSTPPPSAAPADSRPLAPQASFEPAADASILPLPTQAAAECGAWQVTLNDPQGLPVEIRVSRPEGQDGEAAPWNLTVATGAQHATVLAQHAQRLDARLRTRAVAIAHLRVESEGDPPHSD